MAGSELDLSWVQKMAYLEGAIDSMNIACRPRECSRTLIWGRLHRATEEMWFQTQDVEL